MGESVRKEGGVTEDLGWRLSGYKRSLSRQEWGGPP